MNDENNSLDDPIDVCFPPVPFYFELFEEEREEGRRHEALRLASGAGTQTPKDFLDLAIKIERWLREGNSTENKSPKLSTINGGKS